MLFYLIHSTSIKFFLYIQNTIVLKISQITVGSRHFGSGKLKNKYALIQMQFQNVSGHNVQCTEPWGDNVN